MDNSEEPLEAGEFLFSFAKERICLFEHEPVSLYTGISFISKIPFENVDGGVIRIVNPQIELNKVFRIKSKTILTKRYYKCIEKACETSVKIYEGHRNYG